jgi:surface-anchored protein
MNSKTLTILTLLLAAASHSFAAYSDNILNYGHADIGVAFGHHEEEEEGGDHGEEEHGEEFHLHLHGHDYGPAAVVNGVTLTSDAEFDAGDVTILVPLATKATAPDNSAFNAATGAAANSDLWVLPQGNQAGVPFLGIGTEELTASDWGDITFSLGTVTAPTANGVFSIYQGDGLGGFDFYFSSAGANLTENGNNTILAAAGGHDHYNYGFSESGTWLIELTASGTHTTEGTFSDTQTFAFSVVPEPSTYALLFGLAALGLSLARRRAQK